MNQNKNGITGFFKSKGFYIVLIVCVIAAAVSSYLAVETLMDHFVSQGNSMLSNSLTPGDGVGTQVANPESNVPIEDTQEEEASSSEVASVAEDDIDDKNDDVEATRQQDENESEEDVADEVTTQAVSTQQTATPEQATVEPPSFTMPVSGAVIKDFSGDELVYNKTMNDWRTHNGIDIASPIDTAVMAAIGGEVINLEIDDLWGGVVEISSDGIIVRYAGLNPDIAVQKGQQLRSGEIIGKVGELPAELSDESHIHIEAIKNGEYIPFTDLK